MTEYNDKDDRVPANNWLTARQALQEVEDLSFALSSVIDMTTKPGTNEREVMHNAWLGVRHRIWYLHDSLRRLLKDAQPPRPPKLCKRGSRLTPRRRRRET